MGLCQFIKIYTCCDRFMPCGENMLEKTHQWKSQQQKGQKQSLITFTKFIIVNIPSGDARLCEKS